MKLASAIGIPILIVLLFAAGLSPVQSASPDFTYVVNDPSDLVDTQPGDGVCKSTNGNCTLRAAVQDANARFASFGNQGHYTITLPSGYYPLTLAGQGAESNSGSGDLDIMCNLLLIGNANNPPVIDAGAANDRAIEILDPSGVPVSVTIQNVVIQHGQASDYGGGIDAINSGLTMLENVRVISNTAGNAAGGISSAQRMVIDHSLVRANRVITANDSGGGGITNFGEMLISNTMIISNSTGADGGGIASELGMLTLSSSSVLSNTAGLGGGGIASFGPLTVSGSLIQGNIALTAGASDIDSGGGLLSFGRTMMVSSTVNLNKALGVGYGGGIDANDGSLVLERSVVSNNSAVVGGGINNNATMTVHESTVRFNSATDGGGIYSRFSSLEVTDSELNGNSATNNGGGIRNDAILTLTNSTLSFNTANGSGGGLYTGDGHTSNVSSVSFVLNIADANQDGSGDGGGIYAVSGATVYLRDSLLSINLDLSTTTKDPDCAGTIISDDYNLILNATGCTLIGATGNNITGQDPNVGLPQNNGGPTPTSALPAGSIAIDHGNPAGCKDADGTVLTADQRGFARTNRCDIGAFEYHPQTFLPAIRR